MENEVLQWEAPEYEHYEKTTDWFWAVSIIGLAIAALALLMDNALFAIVIIIAMGGIFIFSIRKPRTIEFELSKKGLQVGTVLYPYNTLDSFWVEDHYPHPHSKIIIKSKKVMMPFVIIPLGEAYPEEVRDYLLHYLPEEEHHEPLAQKIVEYLGF